MRADGGAGGGRGGGEGHLSAEARFLELYRTAWLKVVTYLVGLDRELSGGEAEDLAQEVFVVLHRKWSVVQAYDEPMGFVIRTARNLRQNHHRAALRRPTDPLPDPLLDRTGWTWVDGTDLVEAIELRDAIARLTPRQREVVVLRNLIELSVRETAEVLGIATGTVTWTDAEARRALRRMLDPEGEHDG